MRIIAAIAASSLVLVTAASAVERTAPTTPKNNPSIEQSEKNKNKGNIENQNEQDTKAKEQAPVQKRTN